MAFSFPSTKSVLWDHRVVGPHVFLHLKQHRCPVLSLEEKTLRIAHHIAEQTQQSGYLCLLRGSITYGEGDSGLSINVDRIDLGQDTIASDGCLQESDLMPGELLIPCIVEKNSAKPKSSAKDYTNCIELLYQRCRSKSKVDLAHFTAIRAYCSYHGKQRNFIFHIDFDLMTTRNKLRVSPINPVAILPTALSKNLSGPGAAHGECKSGYMTMDQTRKLLLILESDPKVKSLPLIGVWVSGVPTVEDPFVWASCLRYLFCDHLTERVCLPPEEFLLVIFSTLHTKPEFYQCGTSDGKNSMEFELSTCHEVIQLPKDSIGRAQSPLELELTAVESGPKEELLQAAIHNCSGMLSSQTIRQPREFNSHGGVEDIMPRCTPAPHISKAAVIKPTVPEVSLLLDDNIRTTKSATSKETSFCKQGRNTLKPLNGESSSKNAQASNSIPFHGSIVNNTSLPPWTMTEQGPHGHCNLPPHYPHLPHPMLMHHVSNAGNLQGYAPYAMSPYIPVPGMHNMYSFPAPVSMQQPSAVIQAPLNMSANKTSGHLEGRQQVTREKYELEHGQYRSTNASAPSLMHNSKNPGKQEAVIHGTSKTSAQPQSPPRNCQTTKNEWPSPVPDTSAQSTVGSQELHTLNTASPDRNVTDDSGMQSNSSQQSHNNSLESTTASVPADVYEKLQMQDQQLRMLREQLAQLMSTQQAEQKDRERKMNHLTTPSESAIPDDTSSTQANPTCNSKNTSKETCSVAINTSFWYPNSNDQPVDCSSGARQTQTNVNLSDGGAQSWGFDHNDGRQVPSQSEKEPVTFSNDTFSMESLQLSHVLDCTEESMSSQMMVDMPAYTSITPDKSGQRSSSGFGDTDESSHSPQLGESVSMYEQDISGCEHGGDQQPDMQSVDPHVNQQGVDMLYNNQRQFYEQLKGNIKKMLQPDDAHHHRTGGEKPAEINTDAEFEHKCTGLPRPNLHNILIEENNTEHTSTRRKQEKNAKHNELSDDGSRKQVEVNVAKQTLQQLKKMGIDPEEKQEKSFRLDQSSVFFDTAMLPKINYVSMLLDRDSDVSADADALAMKYLTDNQLSELARLRTESPQKSRNDSDLENVISASSKWTTGTSLYANPEKNMSFASRKYLERYGLEDGPSRTSQSEDTTYQSEGESGVLNVKQLLERLADRSRLDLTPDSSLIDGANNNTKHSHKPVPHHRLDFTCSSADFSSIQGAPQTYYSDSESFHILGKPTSTPADGVPCSADSVVSDTTPNRTPHCTPKRRPHHHMPGQHYRAADMHTPCQDTKAERKPLKKCISTPNARQGTLPSLETQQKFGAYLGNNKPSWPKQNSQKPTMEKVLDIDRLKELPKLL